MDYAKLINTVRGIACVVSLRKSASAAGDRITIAAANNNYLASVGKSEEEFAPNRPYSYYVAADPNFESLVNNCISEKKIAHQYVNAGLYKAWLDIYMIPLEDDEEGNGYCLFTYEMTMGSDSDRMISISPTTAYQVLKTCIKLRENDDFKATLDSIVKDIREQSESDGCSIILTDNRRRKIDMLCFDSIDGFRPTEDDVFFKPEFYRIVENWKNVMAGSNCYIITNEEELKAVEAKDEKWYRSLVYSGVRTLVLYPLRVGDNNYGYIFATNFNVEKTSLIREVMELNSFILSAEVENYRMHSILEEMSKTDMLTGVLNRNAMNQRMSELRDRRDSVRSIGLIIADVNGLKAVNDTLGHLAGDEIIKKTAIRIRLVFEGREIYRAGGDEFVILVTDVNKSDFESLVKQLAFFAVIPGEPSFSIGSCYDDTDLGIRQILHHADTEMYRNKEEYYRLHPREAR